MKAKHPIDGTDHFGALEDHGVLELSLHGVPVRGGVADHVVPGHLHALETEAGEPADQVDAVDRLGGQPRGVGGEDALDHRVRRPAVR